MVEHHTSKGTLKKLYIWLKSRMIRTPDKDRKLGIWLIAILWIASTILAIITSLGNPLGVSQILELTLAVTLNGLLFSVCTIVIGFILSLVYLPIPRLTVGSLFYVVFIVIYILTTENAGIHFSIIIGVSYSLGAILIGLILIVLFHKGIRRWQKVIIFVSLIGLLITAFTLVATDQLERGSLAIVDAGDFESLDIDSPAEKGTYLYQYFTYGSGKDYYRPEFGREVDIVSSSVDASHFITKWGDKRTDFWGFDVKELPLNGRVWMPEGEGPFPLMLIVHGNHTMEYFSDDGYGYLGELLASRGIIAISVDQNFINYSNRFGSPNRNYELRAWNLLQHLLEVQQFQELHGNPLYNKVDLQQVALIGHSRGGQAAAMAADSDSFFPNDDSLEGLDNIHIQAVVGIAPTDRTIDNKRPNLKNTYYLVLHGARDADIVNFRGDRQYTRTSFDKGSERFKASLYIADANHSQFNSDWGSMDSSLPRGLFLNQRQTMDAPFQQEVAKVYISAFLESVFHDNDKYKNLFRDYRFGNQWLPNTQYISKFENGTYIPLTEFNQNKDKQNFGQGVTVQAKGFSKWEVISPKDRIESGRLNDAVVLEWNDSASYTTTVTNLFQEKNLTESLDTIVLTMANMVVEGEKGKTDASKPIQEIEVELELKDGSLTRVPLKRIMPISPVIKTQYTLFGLFENSFRKGKYKTSWEPLFQTFELPLDIFEEEKSQQIRTEDISKITLYFVNSPGKILIESVGFSSLP